MLEKLCLCYSVSWNDVPGDLYTAWAQISEVNFGVSIHSLSFPVCVYVCVSSGK